MMDMACNPSLVPIDLYEPSEFPDVEVEEEEEPETEEEEDSDFLWN